MSVKIEQRLFTFRKNEKKGVCGLDAFEGDGITTIIVTELADNELISVTNAMEYIATQFCERYNVNPEKLLIIERYENPPKNKYTWEIVGMKWNGKEFQKPTWTPLKPENFQWRLEKMHRINYRSIDD